MESAVQGATKDGNNWKVEVKDNKTGNVSHVSSLSFILSPYRLLVMLSLFPSEEDLTLMVWVLKTLACKQTREDKLKPIPTDAPLFLAFGLLETSSPVKYYDLAIPNLCRSYACPQG